MPTTDEVRAWLDASDGKVFSNLWQLELTPDLRCSRFVERFMLH